MKTKEGFALRDVCGEQVLVAESVNTLDFSRLISLNSTAAWLWRTAEQQSDFTVESLAQALRSEYDVDEQRAHDDVARIVAQWQEAGIVTA